jgi:ABC-2 type transport system permease protein
VSTVQLIARREITERVREKSFLVSTGIGIVIVVLVVLLSAVLGGGRDEYTVGVTDGAALPTAQAAARGAEAFDAEITVTRLDPREADAALADGEVDVVLNRNRLRSQEEAPDNLVNALQAGHRQAQTAAALQAQGLSAEETRRALDPPPLAVATVEEVDESADAIAGFSFIIVLLLYGQLLTYGYWVAAGVVEEKASRVVEVVLSTVRPKQLLAGKVVGLGLLGLAHLLLTAVIGLIAAQATGALDVDRDIVVATALAVAWFVAGYAFYACAFACAGALVPRQEELQSSMTPLSMTILVSFFASFAVLNDPDGTLARVCAFIPMTAPITMPPRIAAGEASTFEIVASLAVTLGAAAALIPLAARIYSGGVLRTGSALKLKDAWRAARA